MIIKEYRIPLPFTVEEYRIGQLFSVALTSLENTGGGEGVKILKNEAFENVSLLGGKYTRGQYTSKVYHCATKVPSIIAKLVPRESFVIHEESWNAYPYCKTVLTNPGYMKENFLMSVETLHCDDTGLQDNVLEVSSDVLKNREIVVIDIAQPMSRNGGTEDPAQFRSTRTCRGPLEPGKWMHTTKPVMTAYKLVRCDFKWRGLQTVVEKTIHSFQRKIFCLFHRKLFCWIDRWHGMTIDDIRRFEKEIAEELDRQRYEGSLKDADLETA